MRILYHHRTASKDGQVVHIKELIDALRRRGHELVIIGPTFGRNEKFGGESRTITYLKQHLPKAFYELLELSYSIVAYFSLERAYRIHDPDIIYERYNLYLLAGCWLHRRHRLPYFLEVNAPLYEERASYDGIALKHIAKWTQHTAWRAADRVLPVTYVLADQIEAAGVPEERITVIPNGINIQRFLLPARQNTIKKHLGLADKFVLGFTGFIREWHGLDTVVELIAAEDKLNLHLLIVGEGPGRVALAAHAQRLGVTDQLTFTGVVDHETIADYILSFDIALQPSVTSYASPLKLFEYMALGRPVVAPKSPNIEEILTDGENAILFPPEDKILFRAAIQRLCVDRELREKIGGAARRLIDERRLTWDYNAERLERMFEQALAATARSRTKR
ncbi:MAG: glycosyltransferase family 4 protein [Nitrosomonas ureae]